MAVKRSRKTRKTASKTRKIASKTRRKTRKVKKVKNPAKRKKPTKSSNLKHDTDTGTLTLSQYVNAKRKTKQNEIREYEKQYLSRYKQPKSTIKKSSNLKHNTDLGTLTLRQYVNAKRKTKQNEIREYEKQYLSRYKQPKPQKRTSSDLYKPEKPKPKIDRRKERKEYEQKYLSRYKQPKAKPTKSSNLKHDTDTGTLTLSQYVNAKRKTKQNEIREYEKQYLSRYKQPKSGVKKSSNLKHNTDIRHVDSSDNTSMQNVKAKQNEIREYEQKYLSRYKQPKPQKRTSSDLYKPEKPKPKLDMKKERKEYEQKYLSRYKQPKLQKRTSSDLYKPRKLTKTKNRSGKERTKGIRAEISFTLQATKVNHKEVNILDAA